MADSLHKEILQIDSRSTDQTESNPKGIDVNTRHITLLAIVALVVGVRSYGWYVLEIGAVFVALGIVAGLISAYLSDRESEPL